MCSVEIRKYWTESFVADHFHSTYVYCISDRISHSQFSKRNERLNFIFSRNFRSTCLPTWAPENACGILRWGSRSRRRTTASGGNCSIKTLPGKRPYRINNSIKCKIFFAFFWGGYLLKSTKRVFNVNVQSSDLWKQYFYKQLCTAWNDSLGFIKSSILASLKLHKRRIWIIPNQTHWSGDAERADISTPQFCNWWNHVPAIWEPQVTKYRQELYDFKLLPQLIGCNNQTFHKEYLPTQYILPLYW